MGAEVAEDADAESIVAMGDEFVEEIEAELAPVSEDVEAGEEAVASDDQREPEFVAPSSPEESQPICATVGADDGFDAGGGGGGGDGGSGEGGVSVVSASFGAKAGSDHSNYWKWMKNRYGIY